MKFGLIGINFVTDFFMEGANLIDECEVVAVTNIDYESAREYADKNGIPHAFGSYQEMCESGLIEAVYIATPNGLHKEMTEYFLSKGIHTFCEKPMGANFTQVSEMLQAAKENKKYLHEGLVPLFTPNFQIIKDNINRVGKIRQVSINMSQYSSRYDAYLRGENPTTFRRELANGATMDLGVYVFAFCIALFGRPEKILSAGTLLDTGVDVSSSSILVYDGFTASLQYSKASFTENKIEICGENGSLIVNHPTFIQSVIWVDRVSKERTELAVEQKTNFYYEILDMINQIKNGECESSKVPLSLSEDIHWALTESRRQAGIVFPCD